MDDYKRALNTSRDPLWDSQRKKIAEKKETRRTRKRLKRDLRKEIDDG